jgi:hypothetical protein
MNQTSVLLPMLALVGWTLAVLLLIPYQRFKAVFARQLTAHDFKLGESERVPAVVSIPNRNYMNLLEAPVLFYVVCLTLYVAQRADPWAVYLAWAYVGLRVLHSLVHLTHNTVMHRLAFFAASNAVLTVMWLRLLWALS